MDFNVHDTNGVWVGIVESPTSAIWARRFQKPNDFELYFPASAEMLALITDDCYITREDRPEVMSVEHIEIVTSAEDGNYIRITGRGAEALIGRRIILEQTTVSGRADAAVHRLVYENAINPADPERKLPITMDEPMLSGLPITWELGTIVTTTGADSDSTTRFRGVEYIPIRNGLHITMAETQRTHLYYYDENKNFIGYSGWHSVTEYTITPSTFAGAVYVRIIISRRDNSAIADVASAASTVAVHHGIRAQYTGNNLLETVQEVCKAYGLGFRAVSDNRSIVTPRVELLEGVDRSEGQERNSPVIFAAEYENLLSSSYLLDTTEYKNVAIVAGEGEGKNRKRATYGSASGLHRRELFVDARDLSTNEGEISDEDYTAQLTARGAEKIAENPITEAFDGEIDTANFVLDEDYTLGDIVTVENEYSIRKNVRIAAIVECWDENGYTAIPTYENVEV